MIEDNLVQLFFYLLPALIVGALAFYFFNVYMRNEEQRRRFLLQKENQKQALPIRLQAYERMALFLERIAPGNLLLRVTPYNDSKEDYSSLLAKTIEQEFEHNLAQQIYLSEECWNVIKASKNATINNLRKMAQDESIPDVAEYRKRVIAGVLENEAPSDTALAYLKREIGKIL